MNNKFLLIITFLFYVVGDIVTTVWGFSVGLEEQNPLWQNNIEEGYGIKLFVFLMVCGYYLKTNSKIIFVMLIAGIIAVLNNLWWIYAYAG